MGGNGRRGDVEEGAESSLCKAAKAAAFAALLQRQCSLEDPLLHSLPDARARGGGGEARGREGGEWLQQRSCCRCATCISWSTVGRELTIT